jgi:hypothetical protein
MAVLACHDCGREISRWATTCPHCRVMTFREAKTQVWTWLVGVPVLVGLLYLLGAWIYAGGSW